MSKVPLDAAGLPQKLNGVDTLLHRGEANPRTRSGIMGVELLDTTPDWERFRAVFEQASRKVLRLRQKVVMPTLPTAMLCAPVTFFAQPANERSLPSNAGS